MLKIGMVGEVANSVLVRRCRVIELQLVFLGKGDGERDEKVAGIPACAILGKVGEHQKLALDFSIPNHARKIGCIAAVQGIFPLVCFQTILVAMQREFRSADTVAISAYGCAEIRVFTVVIFRALTTDHDPLPFLNGACTFESFWFTYC